MRRMKRTLFAVSTGLLWMAQGYGQVPSLRASDPGVIQQRQIEEERRRREEMREQQPAVTDPLHYEPAPVQAPEPSSQDVVRFMVKEIRFSSSEILSAEELSALVKAWDSIVTRKRSRPIIEFFKETLGSEVG